MYFPHGNYPKGVKEFNLIKMMPALFKRIDLVDMAKTLGHERENDCFDGIMFLYSAQYQQNDGAKLVMMLSAIERSCGQWQSLETFLRSKVFKKKVENTNNGKEANKLLQESIEEYLNTQGSSRSIVTFFKNNLTKKDKLILTSGIRRSHTYKKGSLGESKIFTPVYEQKEESVDRELERLLKNFIHLIRNGFAHKATYIIIPNKEYLEKNKIFRLEVYEKGFPKEAWITILPFEELHRLFCRAFVKYWRKEYFSAKRAIVN